MSSERQFEANRLNALKSTGPATPEGRAAVRLNGIKHGLSAATVVLPDEDPADFEARLDAFQAEYEPSTATEEFLVRQIAMADWRLLRLYRLVAGFFNLRLAMIEGDSSTRAADLDRPSQLAFIAKLDINPQSVLATFHRHEVHLIRSSKTALEQLLKCREQRRANQTQSVPAEPPENRAEPKPGPKIINIETVGGRPPPSFPAPSRNPARRRTPRRRLPPNNHDEIMTQSRQPLTVHARSVPC